jgi:hypothetical protein
MVQLNDPHVAAMSIATLSLDNAGGSAIEPTPESGPYDE